MFVLITICVIIWLYVLWTRRKFYLLAKNIPGVYGWPLLGIAPSLIERPKIIGKLGSLRTKYGSPHFAFLGPEPFLMVSDPVTAEKILTSPKCINKAGIYSSIYETLKGGLFSSPNPEWSHHRKLLNPSFNHKILLSFFPIFNQETDILNEILSKLIANNEIINVFEQLTKLTFSISVQTTMGQKIDVFHGKNTNMFGSFRRAMEILTRRIFIPWLRPAFLFQFSPTYKVACKTQKELEDFILELIENKIKSTNVNDKITTKTDSNDVNITKKPNIFLEQACLLKDNGQFSLNDVVSESIVMVAAAYETTSNSVYLALLCLSMFPEYQEKLFDELFDYFPEKKFEVQYDDLQHLPYLEMVINEAMRVLAPVPIVGRQVSDDLDIGNGIILPKGLQIGMDIFSMHRCEKIWGPKAKTFYPEHFSKENLTNIHPYAFIPFTKGLRNCIGWRYASMAVKLIVAKLMRNYRISTDFKFENLEFVEDIVLNLNVYPVLSLHHREK